MNKKGLFLMGLAAMAFASCSNDDLMSDGSGTTEPIVAGEGEPTYVTFSLNVNGGVKSRAGNYVVPDAEQTAIDSAYLFIFDSGSKALENMFKVKPSTGINSFTELVTAGDKKIYAIANPTAKMKTEIDKLAPKSSESTLDKFLKLTFEATKLADLAELVPSANMPMSSVDSVKTYKLDPGVSETEAAADKNNNNIKLHLLRMVAKTTLDIKKAEYTYDENTKKVTKRGIVGTSTKYTVRNQSQKTYFIQNRGTSIVKSPTYDLTETDYKTAANDFGKHFLWDTTIDTEPSKSLYITENTSFSFLKGAAPYVLIHSQYVPMQLITDASYKIEIQNVEYTIIAPTATEAKNMVVSKESNDETLLANGLYFKDLATFEKAVKEAQKHKPTFSAKSVDYSNGSYYRINLGATVGESTMYGTERNKFYKVNVNSVTGPGWNTPEGAEGTKTDPVDQKTYVNVSITVSDWEEVQQDVDLN